MVAGLRWRHCLRSVAVCSLVALLASCASSTKQHSSRGADDIVGYTWRIVDVEHNGSGEAIPASLDGSISFTADQTLLANDGVNGYDGQFTATTTGYHVSSMAVSAVGLTDGASAVQVALVGGVRAVTDQGADVRADPHGDQLYLTRSGYTITCSRIGVALDPSAPESATAPHTGAATRGARTVRNRP